MRLLNRVISTVASMVKVSAYGTWDGLYLSLVFVLLERILSLQWLFFDWSRSSYLVDLDRIWSPPSFLFEQIQFSSLYGNLASWVDRGFCLLYVFSLYRCLHVLRCPLIINRRYTRLENRAPERRMTAHCRYTAQSSRSRLQFSLQLLTVFERRDWSLLLSESS